LQSGVKLAVECVISKYSILVRRLPMC